MVAGFDGGNITSNAGALLLGQVDRGLGLVRRFADCFIDRRDPRYVEHQVETLVGQHIFGLALGYEDLPITMSCARTRRLRCWRASCTRCCGPTASHWRARRHAQSPGAHAAATGVEGVARSIVDDARVDEFARRSFPSSAWARTARDRTGSTTPTFRCTASRKASLLHATYGPATAALHVLRSAPAAARQRRANITGCDGAVRELRALSRGSARIAAARVILRADGALLQRRADRMVQGNRVDYVSPRADRRLEAALSRSACRGESVSVPPRAAGARVPRLPVLSHRQLEPHRAGL